MKNLIVPFLLPFSMLFSSTTHPIKIEKTAKNEKAFTDLTSEKKKEAIAYMLTSKAISYTHMTMPTILRGRVSLCAGAHQDYNEEHRR